MGFGFGKGASAAGVSVNGDGGGGDPAGRTASGSDGMQQMAGLKLSNLLTEEEFQREIAREREQEFLALNQNVRMVNEIYQVVVGGRVHLTISRPRPR